MCKVSDEEETHEFYLWDLQQFGVISEEDYARIGNEADPYDLQRG